MIDCRPQDSVLTSWEAAKHALPPGVIVAGGSHGSLGIARSLGRRGVPVWALANGSPIQKASRDVTRTCAWPVKDPAAQIACLGNLADRYSLEDWILFPGGDDEVELLARNHSWLSHRFRLTTPDWEVTRWAFDKRLT